MCGRVTLKVAPFQAACHSATLIYRRLERSCKLWTSNAILASAMSLVGHPHRWQRSKRFIRIISLRNPCRFLLYTYIIAAKQIECGRLGHRVLGECYALNNSDPLTLQMSPFERSVVIDQYNMQEQCTIFTCFGWYIDFQLSAK